MKILFVAFILSITSLASANDVVSLDQLKPLGTEQTKISDEHVLIYFWASWCPECREKFANGTLVGIQKEFPQTKIITVNADRDPARGKAFADAEKITLPIFRDDDRSLAKGLKIFGVPAWAVLNRSKDGLWNVQKSATGIDLAEVHAELRKIQ
jgi:thiol-disulfide isomerase/thioredoxin